MAAELEKLVRLYPNLSDVYQDLADRVRHFGGPEILVKTVFVSTPTVRQIGLAILKEGGKFRKSSLFVLNSSIHFESLSQSEPILSLPADPNFLYKPEDNMVTVSGNERRLTPIEAQLFRLFYRHTGTIISPGDVRTYTDDPYFSDHMFRVNIDRLRKKIEDTVDNPQRVIAIQGAGYLLKGSDENVVDVLLRGIETDTLYLFDGNESNLGGKKPLTPMPQKLLEYFQSNANRLLSPGEMLSSGISYWDKLVYRRTNYLEDNPRKPKRIFVISGKGVIYLDPVA